MTVTDEMVLAGAKALHEAWRSWATLSSSKDGMWDGLHQNDRAAYLRDSRTALTAALSDQVVVPKEPTEEMLIAGVIANQSRMVGDVYRAMIAVAPPPVSPAGE